MENQIISFVITQGAFATLFTWLLFDTRKENKEREKKYLETIEESKERERNYLEAISKLSDNLNVIRDVKEDVDYIKSKI